MLNVQGPRHFRTHRPVPYLHPIRVLIREIFVQGYKPGLLQDMLHDGLGHHHPDIVAPVQPAADQGLRIALVLMQGADVMEVEPVAALPLKPAGEEVPGKSQCIAIRGSGLDSLCCQELSRPFISDRDGCCSRAINRGRGGGESAARPGENGCGGVGELHFVSPPEWLVREVVF
jgi:hypothetical protein